MTKRVLWLVIGIVVCLIIATGAYFWATGMIDSLYAFRSPLEANPPTPGEQLGQPVTHTLVFVLIDGLRYDTSLKTDVMPNLNKLRQMGASATMHSQVPSYSEPGYSTLLIGGWPYLHDGPAMNLDYADIPTFTQDNLFSAAHRAGLKTAISGYNWFQKLVPQDAVTTSFYTPGEDRVADQQVMEAALPWVKSGDYSLILIHLDQVDYAGHHEGGPQDIRWDQAANRCDTYLGQIMASLDLQKDTIMVVSDHGHILLGGHGGQDADVLVEPFVIAGAGVKPGQYGNMYMIDVAPTLAALLGTNIPATAQGQVLTQLLNLPQDISAKLPDAEASEQKQLLVDYTAAIGRPVATNDIPTGGNVVPYENLLGAARQVRLSGERLPRAIVAVIVMVIPLVIVFLKRKTSLLWMLAGGMLFLALFNLRYALIDHYTYSLSSLTGVMPFITYCAVTVAIALLVSWLLVAFGLKLFRGEPLLAAGNVLSFVFITLYLVCIPVAANYALNGVLITWTIPSFLPSFLGLMGLIQALLVAVLGVVLTGVTALVARLANR
ncbi:MAG: alkaline phosphatase family protein [Anaerolineaceae bacterium]